MNPLKRIKYNSPVILTYTLLSLAALALAGITGGLSNVYCFSIYNRSWTDPLQYVRLIGHCIGHADFAHLSGNFILILLIGPILEEKYGSKKLLIMILLTAVVTGAMSLIIQPTVMLLGSSGMVFMLIMLSSFASSQSGTVPITLILAVVIYIGAEVAQGASNLMGITTDNVSQLTHITGGVCGIIYGVVVKKEVPAPEKTEE